MSEKPAWMKQLKKNKRQSMIPRKQILGKEISAGKKLRKTGGPKRHHRGLSDNAAQQFVLDQQQKNGVSFTEGLDAKSLEYFNEVCTRTFAEQAQFFLNAFWVEFGSQAEIIYRVHWDVFKKVEMDNQGIQYLHLYEEGYDLDFDMGLVVFEKLVKYFNSSEGKVDAEEYPDAVPDMQTSIKRKKELRSKVDVNFDGRVGFLEYLLYQFKASPKLLMQRSVRTTESNPELDAARAALADVNKKIKAYEAEKLRLEKIAAKGKGVKALGAKNMLAQLASSPLMENLRAALITAEAKVRIVAKRTKTKLKNYKAGEEGEEVQGQPRTDGTIWWMKREIEEKKRLYGQTRSGKVRKSVMKGRK